MYDNGGIPDLPILKQLNFFGKTDNACMVNSIAFVVKHLHLSPKDMATLSDRVTEDCKNDAGSPMYSDLMGMWFQGLKIDPDINIIYGPTKPTYHFKDWVSLRKFNPKSRTFIIGNTGSHYAVYSPG